MQSWKIIGADQTGRARKFKVNAETAALAEAIANRNGIYVSEVVPLDAPPVAAPAAAVLARVHAPDPIPEVTFAHHDEPAAEAEVAYPTDTATAEKPGQDEPAGEDQSPFVSPAEGVPGDPEDDADQAAVAEAFVAEPDPVAAVVAPAPSARSPRADHAAVARPVDDIPVAKLAPSIAYARRTADPKLRQRILTDARWLMAYATALRVLGLICFAVALVMLVLALVATMSTGMGMAGLATLTAALPPALAGFACLVLAAGVRMFASIGLALSQLAENSPAHAG